MPIERLTAEDRVMLWPDEAWPQDIGALAVLDGHSLIDPEGRFRIEHARAAVASRLHLLPRFRQLLHVPPRSMGGPLWVDAPEFDLAWHVKVLELPTPGGEAELLRTAEHLVASRLERSRPLWRMWFLTGLCGGRVAWFLKVHHCIADGIAGIATFGTLLDAGPDVILPPVQPWTPVAAPSQSELTADFSQRRRAERRQRFASFAHPVAAARTLAAAVPAMRELVAEPPLPPTSLTRRVGAGRRLVLVRSTLDAVKAIAHASGAKVNDVLLAAIAGGLRRLLQARGELDDVSVLRVYVPVTLRPLDQRTEARGNQIAEMMVPLPIRESNPTRRLQQIASETAERKARARPPVGVMPTSGLVGRLFLTLIDRQHVNVETADLPGPPIPLYFAGARVLEVFPILPLIGKVALGIGAISYAGQFNITVVGDSDSYRDLEVFAAGMGRELDELAHGARPDG